MAVVEALKALVREVAYASDGWVRHTEVFKSALKALGWTFSFREGLKDETGATVEERDRDAS